MSIKFLLDHLDVHDNRGLRNKCVYYFTYTKIAEVLECQLIRKVQIWLPLPLPLMDQSDAFDLSD